jgi:magnesium transporter
MIKFAFYLAPDGKLPQQVNIDQIGSLLATGKGLLWVDIEDTISEDAQLLIDVFHFHPLAVADCISKNIHPPKIDEFEDHLFIIVHGINYCIESDVVETTELALFAGKNYVVTSHDVPLRSVASIMERLKVDGRPMRRGADMLAHDIIDALVNNIMPTIDELDDRCTSIESEVLEHPKKETLGSIMQLKRSLLALNRVMSPQRETINTIARGDYPVIGKKALIYYRNIYDHLVRIETLTQGLRDLADSVLATYLSSVSNRMNETMRVLSIVATIFLPLTLLAGIYGMNFEYMPELQWRWGYFMVLGIILLVVLIVIWRFWASGWFAWSKRRMAWAKPFTVNGNKIRGYIIPKRKHHKEQ